MKHYIITIITVLLLSKILQNVCVKHQHFTKLESAKPLYVNRALNDFESGVVPFNEKVNFLNQSFKFKFVVVDNIFSDVSAYRLTKANRSFLFGQFTVLWRDAIVMEKFGVDSLWRDYTHPTLYWPPQKNVVYHTFGWAPDSNKFPNNLPAGDIKLIVRIRLQNHTKLHEVEWIFRISYM